MGKTLRCWLVAVVLALTGAVWGQAEFASNGHFIYRYHGVNVIEGDSLLLMDDEYRGFDTAKGYAMSMVDGVQTARCETEIITVVKTVQNRNGFAEATWDIDIKGTPRGGKVELCLGIPAYVLDHWPPKRPSIASHEQHGIIHVESFFGDIEFDVNGSSHSWFLDDLRASEWSKRFRLRVAPDYSKEDGCKVKAVLRIKSTPSTLSAFRTYPLAGHGNRGLRDDVADDGQGGWTDQGTNDLSCFTPGTINAQGVPFAIGDKVIALKGEARPAFPVASPVISLDGVQAERLGFVHTLVWNAAFRETVLVYEVTYADGQVVEIPVRYGMEANDWWNESEPLVARIAWQGDNSEHAVALQHLQWKNPRPDVALKSLRVRSLETPSVPVILGLTALKRGVLTAAQLEALDKIYNDRPRTDVSTDGWYECPIAWLDGIAPGSALDVSFLNDAPAGKHGWLKVAANGHFVFADKPGETVKFWGTNAALYGPYPEKADAPGIARCLARQGVNLLRIHLYALYRDTLIAEDGSLNPEALDKMEFFIAELKKNGVYIFMDWNDGMLFERLLGKPLPDGGKGAKFAALFNRELIAASKKLAQSLFTHVNPYTSLRMVDDPAVCMYEVTNENSVVMNWGALRERVAAEWCDELEVLWLDWQRRQGIAELLPLPRDFTAVGPTGMRFAAELQRAHLEEMKAYYHSLGGKAPISGTNITFTLGELWSSTNMDYMNDHAYADHPNVSAKPMTYNNGCSVTQAAWQLSIIPSFSRAKIAGKPVVASEWNYCYPNDTRCEGLPFMTAYSSFQDWDALLFYCATGSFDSGRWSRFHDTPGILVHSQQTDPATWGLSQASALAFRRGDIRPSAKVVSLSYGPEAVWANQSIAARMPFLAALARVETTLTPAEADAWPMNAPREQQAKDSLLEAAAKLGVEGVSLERVTGDTGEVVRYPAAGLLVVDTPRSKMVTGRLHTLLDGARQPQDLQIESPSNFATITLSSLSDEPIRSAKRMLLCAVGNARNADTKIEGRFIMDMGRKGPVLAEPVLATIAMPILPGNAPLRVYRLDSLSGERRAEIAVTRADGLERFALDKDTQSIYIELIRE